jgi:hypothetical protein
LSSLNKETCISIVRQTFASKPAPTGGLALLTNSVNCGSGLAREEASTAKASLKPETKPLDKLFILKIYPYISTT